MHEHVTLLPPERATPSGGISHLPPDLVEQVRGRVRLLALFLLVGFAFDPVFYLIIWIIATLNHYPLVLQNLGFRAADVAAALASLGLWWMAKSPKISASLLHTVGLIYEVVICFVIAITLIWEYYEQKGIVPYLTWVPVVVILFPLILPGPPRRMLLAAVAAAATAPLGLLVLNLTGKVPTWDLDGYVTLILSSILSVVFAYTGAKVIYRLGREVAEAREMGSYRLEELLGRGGMGEVWRAQHRMLARPAAIKLIRPETALPSRTRQCAASSVKLRSLPGFARPIRSISSISAWPTTGPSTM